MTLGSGQTENAQIRVFVYFPFDHNICVKKISPSITMLDLQSNFVKKPRIQETPNLLTDADRSTNIFLLKRNQSGPTSCF